MVSNGQSEAAGEDVDLQAVGEGLIWPSKGWNAISWPCLSSRQATCGLQSAGRLQESYWRHRKGMVWLENWCRGRENKHKVSLSSREIRKRELLHLGLALRSCPHDLVWLVSRRLQHDSRDLNPKFWPDRDFRTRVAIELLFYPRKYPRSVMIRD